MLRAAPLWLSSGGEASFAYLARFVTANTPIWPRTLVIVAHPDSLEGLTTQEQEWVQAAADDAARWSLDHARDQEVGEIAQACSKGVRIAYADGGQFLDDDVYGNAGVFTWTLIKGRWS